MQLHAIDLAIIALYLLATVLVGFLISKRASKNMDSYFLGGNSIPWYILGVSNASGMFDITGTMWLVYLIFVYGLKGAFIPWLWPVFNQIFLMVYLSCWLRRSNGYGYFWGMIVGLLASLTMPLLLEDVPDFYVFPFISSLSIVCRSSPPLPPWSSRRWS